MTWTDKRVRNKDGRTGRVRSDAVTFGGCDLHIVDNAGGSHTVFLSGISRLQDGGASGWQWYCENFAGGPHWLPLGDHSGCNVEPDDSRAMQNEERSNG